MATYLIPGAGLVEVTGTVLIPGAGLVEAASAATILPVEIGSETDSGFALGRVKAKSADLASETDTSFSFSRLKAKTAQIASEVSAAFALSTVSILSVAAASETDTAFALQGTKVVAAQVAVETDTCLSLSRQKAKAAQLGSEVDSALALNKLYFRATGLSSETDSAFDLSRVKARSTGFGNEIDSAFSLSQALAYPYGLAVEADFAYSLGRVKIRQGEISSEIDKALLSIRQFLVSLETDTALACEQPPAGELSIDYLKYVDTTDFSATATSTAGWIDFSSDGTQMFLLPSSFTRYSLSTPWDPSTATEEDTYDWYGSFSADGTNLYVLDYDEVLEESYFRQHSSSTPWELAEFSSTTKTWYPSLPNGFYTRLLFKSDGTKFLLFAYAYDVEFNLIIEIRQYSMSTAWDISTTSYDNKKYAVEIEVQDGENSLLPDDFDLSEDEEKLFVLTYADRRIRQYSFATAWDVTTLSYDDKFAGVGAQEFYPKVLKLGDGDTKLFIGGDGEFPDNLTANINRYELPRTSSYAQYGYTQWEHEFKKERNIQYGLSVAWDWSTAVEIKEFFYPDDIIEGPPAARGLVFSTDGTKFYSTRLADFDSNEFYDWYLVRYDMSTPWMINTAVENSSKILLLPDGLDEWDWTTEPRFKSDGSEFYVVAKRLVEGVRYVAVLQFELSTSWDPSTAVLGDSFDISDYHENFDYPFDLFFHPSGTKFYIEYQNQIYSFSLTSAWDITTASDDSESFDPSTLSDRAISAECFTLGDNGTKLYVGSTQSRGLVPFDLTTAWDLGAVTGGTEWYVVQSEIYFGSAPVEIEFGPPIESGPVTITIPVDYAEEFDSALDLSLLKLLFYSIAEETDEAEALRRLMTMVVQTAIEYDTAPVMSVAFGDREICCQRRLWTRFVE